MTKVQELAKLGQAVWLDYIRRSFITSGDLSKLIDLGVRGMTSNPSIFEKAIAHSDDYDEDFKKLAAAGKSPDEIFLALVIADIRSATDLFRPVYDRLGGSDGFVSLEVNPRLAHDTEATLIEARRLWSLVDQPNLMVKIPATEEGIPAIAEATAAGVNVNITLIFSLERYSEVMEAYLLGLERRLKAGQPIHSINSVASFFVSRVDTKVDKRLEEIMRREGPQAALAASLRGKAAVANAKLAYSRFRAVFESERFKRLQAQGARLQRPLWASTSTKNPAYSDIKYVQELIGPHTINTMPEETLEAFLDHGEVRLTLEDDLDQARADLQALEDLGVSMEQVTQELEDEGVAAFAKSFDALMDSIAEKRNQMVEGGAAGTPASPQAVASTPIRFGRQDSLLSNQAVQAALEEMQAGRAIQRIWERDYTLWKPQPTEIENRLGWLGIAGEMQDHLAEIQALVEAVRRDGYTQALLLGMGGSSLAPELFSSTFSNKESLDLSALDSTDPGAVLAWTRQLDPNRTLFIVSTKSGTTEETLDFFKYFYNWVSGALGADRAGEHFVAITDPGSKLVDIADRRHFRATFLNNPDIGGRYSALSYFGLVPAALCGVDLPRLLERARQMAQACGPEVDAPANPAARLGTILGELAKAGRDKLTFAISPAVASFGDWVEQLIAESTGKEGKGILPVVREDLGAPAVYGEDRLFVQIEMEGEGAGRPGIDTLEEAGFPVIHIRLQDRYDLGGQFMLWELATAVAGYRLGINPFDQPNVESAKKRAREMVAAYKETGRLPGEAPLMSVNGTSVYGPKRVEGMGTDWTLEAKNPDQALAAFLTQAKEGDYIALQAFIQPTEAARQALQYLRLQLRDHYRLATTAGFGPRFLHSTGQLHKGDAGRGLFIQFTTEHPQDAPIPDEAGSKASSISFGVLELAQALGDRQALQDAGRRVIRFHLAGDAPGRIRSLASVLNKA